MRLKPEHPSCGRGIDAGPFPPSRLVTAAVEFAMVSATQGDRELIADFASERTALSEPQVVGIRGLPAADQAGPPGDKPDMLPV